MRKVKILALCDNLTYSGLSMQDNVFLLPLLPYTQLNKFIKPDFILVESAWFGFNNFWKHALVDFPNKPNNLEKLIPTLEWAKKNKIKTIFWNKEDPIHFDKFIQCASLFDIILTTDINCVDKYKKYTYSDFLPFAYQPKIHFYNRSTLESRIKRGLFMGSYLSNNHPHRKEWQDSFFPIFSQYGLDIYDRNSKLKNKNYAFPTWPNTKVYNGVSYKKTGKVMQKYSYCINVNTITNSPTMFSRRLLENLASGCITFTNSCEAIDRSFKEHCIVLNNTSDLYLHLEYIHHGKTKNYIDQVNSVQEKLKKEYSYEAWVEKILKFL